MLTNEEEIVLAAASHALVLRGYTLPNQSRMGWIFHYDELPDLDLIEQFFQALSIIQPQETGYAQVAYRPIGWRFNPVAQLPDMIPGAIVSCYPPALHKKSLREPVITLQADAIEKLKKAHKGLASAKPFTRLGGSRLAMALRRESETDRLVDLCIGIEAFLNDSPGETTYKVSMRLAAILATEGMTDTSFTFSAMKKIYAYRSAIVHGSSGKKKVASTIPVGEHEVPLVTLAEEFLRKLIAAFLGDNTLTAQGVDERYILQSLSTHVQTGY
jgi:hypothetical protein